MGQVGEVCCDLLVAELKEKQKIFKAKLCLETGGGHAYVQGTLLPAEPGWNEQLPQPELGERPARAAAWRHPRTERCLGCGTGARVLGFACRTSAQRCTRGSDGVTPARLFCLLFGTRAGKTCESSAETEPVKQKQKKAPASNMDTKMSVHNKN